MLGWGPQFSTKRSNSMALASRQRDHRSNSNILAATTEICNELMSKCQNREQTDHMKGRNSRLIAVLT